MCFEGLAGAAGQAVYRVPMQEHSKNITLTPIGIIRTSFTRLEGMPIQPAGAAGAKGTVVVNDSLREGLADLDGFSHIVLLYCFHASRGYDLEVVPFLDDCSRGVFATRAPRRPNPIGLSVVRLDRIDGHILHVRDIDVLDGTPLLDIKPYAEEFNPGGDIRSGWLAEAAGRVAKTTSDDRFT